MSAPDWKEICESTDYPHANILGEGPNIVHHKKTWPWILILAVIVFCVEILTGQELPEVPKPHLDKTEWSLLAVDAATRSLDVYSTHQMLAGNNHEDVLPDAISHHPVVMSLFSGSCVAMNWYIARKLERQHRTRLTHIATMIDISVDAPAAIHNLFLPQTRKLIITRGIK